MPSSTHSKRHEAVFHVCFDFGEVARHQNMLFGVVFVIFFAVFIAHFPVGLCARQQFHHGVIFSFQKLRVRRTAISTRCKQFAVVVVELIVRLFCHRFSRFGLLLFSSSFVYYFVFVFRFISSVTFVAFRIVCSLLPSKSLLTYMYCKQAELSNANELPRTYVVFLTGVSVNGFFAVQYRGECLLFILTASVKLRNAEFLLSTVHHINDIFKHTTFIRF